VNASRDFRNVWKAPADILRVDGFRENGAHCPSVALDRRWAGTYALAEVDELHSRFADDHALHGRLRVDLPADAARTTIVPALPDFMATHPELELEVSRTGRLVDPQSAVGYLRTG
jgi:hypothetical protein